MSPQQAAAFTEAAGFLPSQLTLFIKLFVGGLAVLCVLLILVGLMRLVDGESMYDKSMFFIYLFAVMFTLMLIFAYIA